MPFELLKFSAMVFENRQKHARIVESRCAKCSIVSIQTTLIYKSYNILVYEVVKYNLKEMKDTQLIQ